MPNIYNNEALRRNLLSLLDIKSYDQLNKARFAELTGLQADAIKKLTSGATQNPGIKTIVAIANKLGCSIDDLVGYKPKLQSVNSIISQDLNLNKKLLESTINYIFHYTDEKKIEPKIGKIFHALDTIYDYSFRRKLSKPDKKFADWILSSIFEESL